MKRSPAEEESMIALLTRIYIEICGLETDYQLFAGEGDFRPRIEYFHDAVRALSSGDHTAREEGGRLSVELLAYDLSCLRYLASMPLSPFKPHAANLSPSTELVKLDQHLVPSARRPDRATKEKIGELYQHYAVMFAALLKPFADRDYLDRVDNLNKDVREVSAISQELAAGNPVQVLLDELEDNMLRYEIASFLQQKHRKKEDVQKLIQYLKGRMAGKDKEIAGIESAHMNYALAQLAVYEESKDMLKKLASQGLNLVGKFVEASVAKTKREMGR